MGRLYIEGEISCHEHCGVVNQKELHKPPSAGLKGFARSDVHDTAAKESLEELKEAGQMGSLSESEGFDIDCPDKVEKRRKLRAQRSMERVHCKRTATEASKKQDSSEYDKDEGESTKQGKEDMLQSKGGERGRDIEERGRERGERGRDRRRHDSEGDSESPKRRRRKYKKKRRGGKRRRKKLASSEDRSEKETMPRRRATGADASGKDAGTSAGTGRRLQVPTAVRLPLKARVPASQKENEGHGAKERAEIKREVRSYPKDAEVMNTHALFSYSW
jgi:hypothetical protein